MTQSDQDFVMSYPCFLVGREPGSFTTVDVDGIQCLCLFMDEDLAMRHREQDGPGVMLTPFFNRENLLNALEMLEPELRDDGILHVAIDSAPGKRTLAAPVADLIAELRAGRI